MLIKQLISKSCSVLNLRIMPTQALRLERAWRTLKARFQWVQCIFHNSTRSVLSWIPNFETYSHFSLFKKADEVSYAGQLEARGWNGREAQDFKKVWYEGRKIWRKQFEKHKRCNQNHIWHQFLLCAEKGEVAKRCNQNWFTFDINLKKSRDAQISHLTHYNVWVMSTTRRQNWWRGATKIDSHLRLIPTTRTEKWRKHDQKEPDKKIHHHWK